MNIGKVIREERKRLGISQKDLAKLSGMSVNAMFEIEKGRMPSAGSLANICTALNLSVAYVFTASLELSDVAEEKREVFAQTREMVLSLLK